MKKKIFQLVILSLLLLPSMSVLAGRQVVTEINPILSGGQRRVTVREVAEVAGGQFQSCDETASDYNSFKLAVLRRLRQKDTDFTICFQAGYQPSKDVMSMLDKINQDQDVPWLSNSWYEVTAYAGATQFTYKFEYWHNQQQEAELETAVRDQVRQLVPSGMDMPTREKTIHDWMVKHITYDQSLVRYSDYNAFFDRSAVCQGYALLTDRMLAMAGVEDKIVIGKAGGGDHAWNMVQLCGNWFHLDTTFDDPVGMGPDYIRWDYYNVTDSALGFDHSWTRSDYPPCNTTYNQGYCQGEVINGCSIFAPEQCRSELACMNASGTWSGGSCLVPGSGGGGGTVEGFPSTPMNPVVYPGSASPTTMVTVPAGMVALTPQLWVGNCDRVLRDAIAYIYMPAAHFGLSVPATPVCNSGMVTINIGAGSLDFTGYPGTYYIYFGYVDDSKAINYNAYELIVK